MRDIETKGPRLEALKRGAKTAGLVGGALAIPTAIGAGTIAAGGGIAGALGAGPGKRGEGAKLGAKTELHRSIHPIQTVKQDWKRGPRALVVPASYDEAKKLRKTEE